MKLKYKNENEKMFGDILEQCVGEKLACNDGSGMPPWVLRKKQIPFIAENLAQWFAEEYDGIELTPQYAEEYLDETYPVA